jgi:hypothetical protein
MIVISVGPTRLILCDGEGFSNRPLVPHRLADAPTSGAYGSGETSEFSGTAVLAVFIIIDRNE